MLRRTYHLCSWRDWDQQVDLGAQDFFERFGVYPNLVFANLVTYKRIDIIAKREQISNDAGVVPKGHEYIPIGGFVAEEYELSFCIDERLNDKAFALIFESNPDSGEPIPTEDTIIDKATMRRQAR